MYGDGSCMSSAMQDLHCMGSDQDDESVKHVNACACRDVEQAGCVTFQSQLCMSACVCRDVEQAGCVTFQSHSAMHARACYDE